MTVEINGYHHALHLFAGSPEEDRPDANDPNVHYFGPGVHDCGEIILQSGQTVYLAGGAVVYGGITGTDIENICICGRGILDNSRHERGIVRPIVLHGCRNVTIEGIIIRDACEWVLTAAGCTNVQINNIKLIGMWRYNSDGIDICNCSDVLIENCFIRTFDDSIVLKGLAAHDGYPCGHLPLRNVTAQGCVIWTDWGRGLELGAETCAPKMSGIVFRDCDIIHAVHVAMDSQNSDRAEVKDVRFENIRVELDESTLRPIHQTAPGQVYDMDAGGGWCPRLFVIEIRKTMWSHDGQYGRVSDVRLEDIDVTGHEMPESLLAGYDADHGVCDIAVENLCVNGRKISDAVQGRFVCNAYVTGLRVMGR